MKQLTTTESIIMLIGAVLMVIGTALLFFDFAMVAPWFFLAGAIAFTTMQLRQSYEGSNFTIRRLRRIMIAGDIFFLLSALMMIENSYNFMLPFFIEMSPDGYLTYVRYISNNWVVLLLVAAVLELYSTHRITYELRKDAKKN